MRRRLGDLHAALDPLLEPLAPLRLASGASPEGSITPLDGAETVDEALAAAFAEARERLLVVRPPELPMGRWLDPSLSLLERGAAVKFLYPHSLRSNKPLLGRFRPLLREGAEIRTTTLPALPMLLFDSATAFVPAWLEIRHRALTGYLAEFFAAAWERSSTLGPEPVRGEVAQEVELAVAQLLVAGHVDETIARKLGMSVRACRRYVAALCRRLGAGSRVQLGFRIASSGLLDGPPARNDTQFEPARESALPRGEGQGTWAHQSGLRRCR
ncbi:helix-turn-helix transcriptional regulator [Actinomadura viridis]|uniref:DNA-binding CsgD family transcriptional regulator n=1 Tax=Actinomadura viridis TaxID=58110 RepID=A0A931DQ21_9ACTN|nr:hypothetical protein [Actinomadura viridis]MBG6091691.1 DNA-binding CsgD family transcriptional regulator [Actinomadura viridis]